MDTWRAEKTWPGTPESVGQARHFATRRVLEAGLNRVLDDARLIVSELSSNAVGHARTAFTLTLVGGDSSLLLSVRDWGPGQPVASGTDRMADGHRGLGLVEALSTSWGVTPADGGGKSVWAHLSTLP